MTNQNMHLKTIFPEPPVIAYRRPKNLGEHLIRAKLSLKRKSKRKHNGFKLCGAGVCKTCAFSGMRPSEIIKSHKCQSTGEEWNITAPIDCHTTDVLYRITCIKCPDFVYIGETSRKLSERLTQHRGYVNRQDLSQPTGAHFNGPGHSLSDMRAIAFERILPKGNHMMRKQRESMWINRYDSARHGANTRL